MMTKIAPGIRKRRCRGSLVIATSLFLSIAVVSAFAGIIVLYLYDLLNSTRSMNRNVALFASQSGSQEIISKIMADPTYGTHSEDGEIRFDDEDLGRWRFEGSSRNSDVFFSTNNFNGISSVTGGDGKPVPPYSIKLFVKGVAGDQRVVTEMLIKRSTYRYVIATTGYINSGSSPLLVSAVRSTQDYIDGRVGKLQADILSNYAGSGAVIAGQGSSIDGSVYCVGSADIRQPSNISGRIHQGVEPRDIPEIDISQWDPEGRSSVIAYSPSTYPDLKLKMVGFCNGDIEIANLELNGFYLYAKGNVKITGGVKGSGAVMSEKNITIMQAANIVSGDNKAAILAKGDIEITGEGPKDSFINGIIYTRADFRGKDLTLLGYLLAKSVDPGKGKATIQNLTVVGNEEMSELNFGPVWFDSGNKYSKHVILKPDSFKATIALARDALSRGDTSKMEGDDGYMAKLDEYCGTTTLPDGTPISRITSWPKTGNMPLKFTMKELWAKYRTDPKWYKTSDPTGGYFYKIFSEISGIPAGLDNYIVDLSLNKYLSNVSPSRIVYERSWHSE